VGRSRLLGLLVGVSALIALAAPASAVAGTFSWSLPNDFTTTAPGSNPEHKYGAVSWTYEVDGRPLSQFSTNLDGGSGWTDGSGDDVAVAGGTLQMDAAAGHSVSVVWTNPFTSTHTVSITNTLTSLCPLGMLTQSPSGSSVSLAPGKSVTVTLTAPLAVLSCMAKGGIAISASTPGPTVTLNSPGTAPLHTPTVQLSGTAGTGFTDASQVTVALYSGKDASGSPIHQLTASVDSSGNFAVQTPALADGQYTAVASQTSGAGTGKSPAVTFRIKAHAPALTLFQPPGDVWIGRSRLSFSGQAGSDPGDASKVTLRLYRGNSAGGTLVGRRDVKRRGARWSTRWAGLRLGYYTVVATQSDDAGHTGHAGPHTFRLVSKTRAFGPSVNVSGHFANVVIGCLAPNNTSCRGTVLVVTKHSYRTAPGGPSGPLEVLFANVRIPGGTMGIISGRVPSGALRVLRRLRHVQVTVTSKMSKSGDRSASRVLRVS
jgi:hypothetical protein